MRRGTEGENLSRLPEKQLKFLCTYCICNALHTLHTVLILFSHQHYRVGTIIIVPIL